MRKEDQWNKQGTHEIVGDGSCEISAYNLSITDQDKERRNFPGFQTHSLTEGMKGTDSGTTHTRGNKSGKA